MEEIILLLGSNKGNRINFLREAVKRLSSISKSPVLTSSVYESEPWGFDADEQFLNMVAVIRTFHSPVQLIQLFRSIEGRMGRRRSGGGRYESRVIDLDILLWEERVISIPGLEVPHPKIADRRFVLKPLSEVAPAAVHPVTGLTVAEMLQLCDDNSDVRLAARQL